MNYSCNPQFSHFVRKQFWSTQQRALTLTHKQYFFHTRTVSWGQQTDLTSYALTSVISAVMTSQMSLSLPLGPTCRQEVTTSTDPVTITLRTKRTCTQSLTRRSPVFCHSVVCIVAVCVTVCTQCSLLLLYDSGLTCASISKQPILYISTCRAALIAISLPMCENC